MTITAFLEAAKKATAGPVEVSKAICPEHQTETLSIYAYPNPSHCVEVLESGCKCGDEAMSEEDAHFWVAARNAAPDIEELVGLCREYFDPRNFPTKPARDGIVDRIRGLVK